MIIVGACRMTFVIGKHRSVIAENTTILIRDERSIQFAKLNLQRWSRIREDIQDIDIVIEGLLKGRQDVDYKRHIGVLWFVTLKSGGLYVNIRKYFTSNHQLNLQHLASVCDLANGKC